MTLGGDVNRDDDHRRRLDDVDVEFDEDTGNYTEQRTIDILHYITVHANGYFPYVVFIISRITSHHTQQ